MFSGLVCTFNQFAKCNSKHPSKQEVLNLVIQSVCNSKDFLSSSSFKQNHFYRDTRNGIFQQIKKRANAGI